MSKILLMTGPPGSGKTTIARALAECFPNSLHIQVDHLREMMVKGVALPDTGFTEEANQQFQWARATAIYMAKLYAEHGAFVVIDDVSVPETFQNHYKGLFGNPAVQRVLLLPSASKLIERMRNRGGPWEDDLIKEVPWLYSYLEPMPKKDWIVLDSGDWTIEQTVKEVCVQIGVNPDVSDPSSLPQK